MNFSLDSFNLSRKLSEESNLVFFNFFGRRGVFNDLKMLHLKDQVSSLSYTKRAKNQDSQETYKLLHQFSFSYSRIMHKQNNTSVGLILHLFALDAVRVQD